jgi:hypothetical protein
MVKTELEILENMGDEITNMQNKLDPIIKAEESRYSNIAFSKAETTTTAEAFDRRVESMKTINNLLTQAYLEIQAIVNNT